MIVKSERQLRAIHGVGYVSGTLYQGWVSDLGLILIGEGDYLYILHGIEPQNFGANLEDIFNVQDEP